ncbi:MAG TPA: CopG family transcriptional regulator [Vicinamibacteria bacterium]|nr:CopG family transcriptional regulator [Vicinamibacteria bacterium]
MRTTLTLDEDVAARIKAESRRSGRSFKETVNEALRLGLERHPRGGKAGHFRVKARPMGLRPGLSLDCTSALLEELEGPDHR